MSATIPIIDADSHLAEPPDLWTSRMSAKKWGDQSRTWSRDERLGLDRWIVGGKRLTSVANWAVAGWHEHPPSHPPTHRRGRPRRLRRPRPPGPHGRVRHLRPGALPQPAGLLAPRLHRGERGVRARVRAGLQRLPGRLRQRGPDRFILLASLPFWDVQASIAEIDRCADKGFRGVLFIAKPYKLGLPPLSDDHWDPLFARLQELGWSMNFHTGFAEFSEDDFKAMLSRKADRRDYASSAPSCTSTTPRPSPRSSCRASRTASPASTSSPSRAGSAGCRRSSSRWTGSGSTRAPTRRSPTMEMPSFYFRRQVYGMFWFETESLKRQVDLFPDNLMFETDFPHPTSLSPGPASPSDVPSAVGRQVRRGPAGGTRPQDPVGERGPGLPRARAGDRLRNKCHAGPLRARRDRPGDAQPARPMNGLSDDLMEELFQPLRLANADAETRVVVVTGPASTSAPAATSTGKGSSTRSRPPGCCASPGT